MLGSCVAISPMITSMKSKHESVPFKHSVVRLYIWKRLFAPQRGGLGAADQLFAPERGGLAAADKLFAPQRGGQEKQLCYSARSWASKSKITGKVI